MGMQIGADDDDDIVSAINTTPLVDVMLVLLIIFLITIPVATRSIAVKLPEETARPRQSTPQTMTVGVDKSGTLFWNESPLAGEQALVDKLKTVATAQPQPEIQVRGDQDVRYEFVGRVVNASQRAGIQRISFVTEPHARGD
jgi:biopolymer transport protein ExbD